MPQTSRSGSTIFSAVFAHKSKSTTFPSKCLAISRRYQQGLKLKWQSQIRLFPTSRSSERGVARQHTEHCSHFWPESHGRTSYEQDVSTAVLHRGRGRQGNRVRVESIGWICGWIWSRRIRHADSRLHARRHLSRSGFVEDAGG